MNTAKQVADLIAQMKADIIVSEFLGDDTGEYMLSRMLLHIAESVLPVNASVNPATYGKRSVRCMSYDRLTVFL